MGPFARKTTLNIGPAPARSNIGSNSPFAATVNRASEGISHGNEPFDKTPIASAYSTIAPLPPIRRCDEARRRAAAGEPSCPIRIESHDPREQIICPVRCPACVASWLRRLEPDPVAIANRLYELHGQPQRESEAEQKQESIVRDGAQSAQSGNNRSNKPANEVKKKPKMVVERQRRCAEIVDYLKKNIVKEARKGVDTCERNWDRAMMLALKQKEEKDREMEDFRQDYDPDYMEAARRLLRGHDKDWKMGENVCDIDSTMGDDDDTDEEEDKEERGRKFGGSATIVSSSFKLSGSSSLKDKLRWTEPVDMAREWPWLVRKEFDFAWYEKRLKEEGDRLVREEF